MIISRRSLLCSAALLPILTLPGCAETGRFSLVEAIRRLLSLSAQRAFANLMRENGFYDDQLARISLPDALGGSKGADVLAVLASALFRNRLTKQVNRAAEKGAELAAPVVADAVLNMGIPGRSGHHPRRGKQRNGVAQDCNGRKASGNNAAGHRSGAAAVR